MNNSKLTIPSQQASVYVFKQLPIVKGIGKKALAILLKYLYPQSILCVKTNKSGKPYIVDEHGCITHLHVSISHSKMALVIVLAQTECGIDIEYLRYPEKVSSVYAWITHPEDRVKDLTSNVFLRTWTLKEAWLKLKSLGLEFGMDNIRFCAVDSTNNQQLININQEQLYTYFFSVTESDQTCVVSEEPLMIQLVDMTLDTQIDLATPSLSFS
ncbi:4'-phosphopantetheinyl transferase family protein [Pseudoalteromonas luteoviolacea]|uniref:4'-phosphopantetheinyl transferase family protein n=1 Tax=Pseudoalteromonas luteoviolacea TaxID=43657 RepID=UPI001151506B|nr:4'-phosphopantetheinyl transferase superfamily protein [Pseudoalteromonas luteoviolacea]TQF67732.1 4'-phosphopantetheinyl transferase superfamily protein [Pseudoalteromonas luteoviolacea]